MAGCDGRSVNEAVVSGASGYDSNTKQAHEDAKQKTADRETQELENAPPQSQLKVVREYGEGMREILAKMPQAEQKKTKV